MMNTQNDFHRNYKKALTSFATSYPEATADFTASIDSYLRTCALIVWSNGYMSASDCLQLLEDMYTDEGKKQSYTIKDIEAAKDFLMSKNYNIPIPAFFYNIIKYDLSNGTSYSRRFAEGMRFVLAMFIIEGPMNVLNDSSDKKAIDNIYKGLISACDKKGVKPYSPRVRFESLGLSNYKEIPNNKSVLNKKELTKNTEKPTKSGLERLDDLVGLVNVKDEIKKITNYLKIQKMREQENLPTTSMSYHLVFTGNPGTGKTTVARIIAQIYKELGVLSKGQLIETDRSGLVSGYVGQTAIKTHDMIERAKGGVLFIDEAYSLSGSGDTDYGQEAIDTLIKGMEDYRNDLVVIVAGYNDQMRHFIDSNPGLESRFNRFIDFPDYTGQEMLEIFLKHAERDKYTVDNEVKDALLDYYNELYEKRTEDFSNGRLVRNHYEKVISNQASRLASIDVVNKPMLTEIAVEDLGIELEDKQSLDAVMAELNALIGLTSVKDNINDMINLIKVQQARKEKGLATPSINMHLVFTGNPGTGKTTVARLIGKIYKALGLLSKGQMIETDRSGLVAGYVGQTAIKTKDVIKQAEGGVLFIDEAYTLASGGNNDFGQEAIDTLLKAMEDKRSNMVVIVAGYPDLMRKFINSNPGLESRFNQYIDFPDYNTDEMTELFLKLCSDNQYSLEDEALVFLRETIEKYHPADIGNGRGIRNIFEKAMVEQANRLTSVDDEAVDYQLIKKSDIENALLEMRGAN